MKATETLARFISNLQYKDLPASVVEAAKVAIIDGVANMLAGSAQPLAAVMGEYVREMGGSPKCSVVGWGFKTNAPSAAFANGVFGHCLDFEIQGHPPNHGTSSCLPAALALGEELRTSGKSIIEAFVVGWEIQGRLRAASARSGGSPGWHPPGQVGPLGGAASSAKLLGLDLHETRMALGIAASRTGGLTANTGTMVKSTHPGNAARMGAEAAILARAGYTSNPDILEAPNGYATALFRDKFDWERLTIGLGETYRLVDPGFDIKRFPAKLSMQRPIEAVLNLRQRYDLQADQVKTLTIQMWDQEHSGVIPKSGLHGKFSIEYCAAAALLDGQVDIETFADQKRFLPDMEETIRKIEVVPGGDNPTLVQTTALLTDGRTVSEECQAFRGSTTNPMSRKERLSKFRECASRVLGSKDMERLVETLESLESLRDVSDLMSVLSKKPAPRSLSAS
jgi:2-methylcitrate dehydratase PrpD